MAQLVERLPTVHVHAHANLVLSVVGLGVLDDSVAQSEQVEHGLVPLVCQLRHLEGGLLPQRNPQQMEHLVGEHCDTHTSTYMYMCIMCIVHYKLQKEKENRIHV